MITVSQLLRAKGRDVWYIAPDACVIDALKLMADKEVGALVVLEGETLVGIISERDYARKVMLKEKSSMDTPVSEIMTPNPETIDASQSIFATTLLMTQRAYHHLPVMVEGELKGILAYNTAPLVSMDFNHDPASSTVEASQTKVIGNLVKVLSWYDNEWGFSNRMLDTTKALMSAG